MEALPEMTVMSTLLRWLRVQKKKASLPLLMMRVQTPSLDAPTITMLPAFSDAPTITICTAPPSSQVPHIHLLPTHHHHPIFLRAAPRIGNMQCLVNAANAVCGGRHRCQQLCAKPSPA